MPKKQKASAAKSKRSKNQSAGPDFVTQTKNAKNNKPYENKTKKRAKGPKAPLSFTPVIGEEPEAQSPKTLIATKRVERRHYLFIPMVLRGIRR